MIIFKKSIISILFSLFAFSFVPSQNYYRVSTPITLTEIEIPIPQDLCGNLKEKKIRKRLKDVIGLDIVPCGHGVLRFLEFTISKKDVLIIVTQDNRPSYISGGSQYCSYALVDNEVFYSHDEFLKIVPQKDKLSNEEIVNLFVAVVMLQYRPNIILNNEQRRAVAEHWPEAENAFLLNPPGLYKNGNGHLTLQAWTTHEYSERGVGCRYIKGFRISYSRKTRIKLECNHEYADGTNMGQPCGKPIPGTIKEP